MFPDEVARAQHTPNESVRTRKLRTISKSFQSSFDNGTE